MLIEGCFQVVLGFDYEVVEGFYDRGVRLSFIEVLESAYNSLLDVEGV